MKRLILPILRRNGFLVGLKSGLNGEAAQQLVIDPLFPSTEK